MSAPRSRVPRPHLAVRCDRACRIAIVVASSPRYHADLQAADWETEIALDASLKCRVGRVSLDQEAAVQKSTLSVAGTSVLLALALAGWEVYFFWFAGSFKNLEGTVGLFGP